MVNVLLSILYFLLFYGFFEVVMFRKGITYWHHPLIISAYFIIATAISLVLFSFLPIDLLFNSSVLEWISFVLILGVLMFLVQKGIFKIPNISVELKSEAKRQSAKYVFSKSADIFFQDVLAVIVALAIVDFTNSLGLALILFTIYFIIAHILLVFVLPIRFAIIFVLASSVAGLLFGWLIIYEQSIIYVFVLHWIFYVSVYPVIRKLLLGFLRKGR